jgi:hypothetical protein
MIEYAPFPATNGFPLGLETRYNSPAPERAIGRAGFRAYIERT